MSHRVLVADDRSEILRMLRARFEFEDDLVVVGEARNGAEAVGLAHLLQPDVVVLDLEMPVMRGDVAIPLLRIAVRGVLIVLYTGAALDLDRDVLPDIVIDKARPLDELVEQITAALARRAARQAS